MARQKIWRSWRSVILAPAGDGTIRRRGTDVLRLIGALVTVIACWAILLAGGHFENAVVGFLTPPPSGVKWLVTMVWVLGSFGVIVLVVVLALAARRPAMARDVVVAGAVTWGLAYLIETLVGVGGRRLSSPSLAHVDLHYPQPRVAVAVAVALVAVPYLARGFRRAIVITVAVTALATIVHGSGLPTSVLASIALGWGIAAAVHLVFGTPLGLPSPSDVSHLLGELGFRDVTVTPLARQDWGVARYTGTGGTRAMAISVYGRDARDAQLFAKAFRYAFYRDSGPTVTVTRLQQVEREAYLTLLARSQGARVPEVERAARAGPSRDAVLVTTPPPGRTLADLIGEPVDDTNESDSEREGTSSIGDPGLDSIFEQLVALRAARIAHGGIGTDTVVLDGDHAGIVEFRRASSDATQDQLDLDTASTLATVGLAAGATRAIASAHRTLPADQLTRALPFLQRAALPPALARRFRGHKDLLASLRQEGADAIGVEVPKLTEARRISWVNLLLILGSLIGGWALIGVLLDVGRSFDTITGADWGWVLAVFVLAAATYPALSLEVIGAVIDPLPYGRVLALEIADTFLGLAGGTMAVLAARVRFFQQQGQNATLAVSSGVLISTASWIVKGGLFLIALPFGIGSIHFDESPAGGSSRTVWLIVVAVAAIGLALGIVLAVPRLRRLAKDKLRPKITDVLNQLKALAARPRKLMEIFGGAIGAQLCTVLALGASIQAFGSHVSIATLLVVMTLASMLGGASPVPGGVGVVEAGLILGLTSAGVPEDQAVAAVFVQRLFTSYLPPLAGWFVLVSMRRREYI